MDIEVRPMGKLPGERVEFTREQLAVLEKVFPRVVMTPESTPEAMHHYFGAQSVIEFIRTRTR